MRKKGLLALLFAALLLSVVLSGCSQEGGEHYRSVKVLEVTGTATLLRDGEEMAVYSELLLQGGDQITTDGGSRVDLRLDEDKYVVLEESTVVRFELAGSPEKGHIRLHQTSGTIHHQIENPLAAEDAYEVHTPEAVMAVRGTAFTTSRAQVSDGYQTRTQVERGKVDVTPGGRAAELRTLMADEAATVEQILDAEPHFVDDLALCCPACGVEVESKLAHELPCGHLGCDSADHETRLPCGNPVCTEGHELLSCGHCICDGEEHDQQPCGHFACAGGDHETLLFCGSPICLEGHEPLDCGHCICQDGTHEQLSCGHFGCAEGDHETLLSCGNPVCTEGHESLDCRHCSCTGGSHQWLSCGHYACDGKDHTTTLSCGNPVCTAGHGALECGHCGCDGVDHSLQTCGHFACDGKDHTTTLSCGNPVCLEGHAALDCGHCQCASGSHTRQACGHYGCDGGDHSLITDFCGSYACAPGHGRRPCGCCLCNMEFEHERLECGHLDCSEGDHFILNCGNFGCTPGHSFCMWCGDCTCTGEHGEGICWTGWGSYEPPVTPLSRRILEGSLCGDYKKAFLRQFLLR